MSSNFTAVPAQTINPIEAIVAKLSNGEAVTTAERDMLIQSHAAAKTELAAKAAAEMTLRNAVVKAAFADLNLNDAEGTKNVELGNGWKLKVVFKLNRKLDPAKADIALEKLEKEGEAGALLAERVVKWKPELSKSEYDKLNDKQQSYFGDALTITAGTPSVELVPPAEKK